MGQYQKDNQMPCGLDQQTVAKIRDIFARHENIDEVILYGSRAKGNYKPGSDIDLTLKGNGLNLEQLNIINNELDDLLLPYAFDISIFHQISNPDLIDHINRVGKIFYKRREH
jgi:predicted nucleotidyltransferase